MMARSLRVALLLTVTTCIFAEVNPQHGYGPHPGYGLSAAEHVEQSRGYGYSTATAVAPPQTGGVFPTSAPAVAPPQTGGVFPTSAPAVAPPQPMDLDRTHDVLFGSPTANPSGKSCAMQIPATCVFPFYYKSLKYTTCTGVNAVGKMWCSKDQTYAGRFATCKDPCPGKWPAQRIASTVVAGSVAATGLGLIIAAVADESKHGHRKNPFAEWFGGGHHKCRGGLCKRRKTQSVPAGGKYTLRKLGDAPTGEMDAIQNRFGQGTLPSTASIVDAPVFV